MCLPPKQTAVLCRAVSQNFNSTRHNTASVSLSNRIETNSTLVVLSGPVDCPIRQELLRCYCLIDLKTRLPLIVSCRVELSLFLCKVMCGIQYNFRGDRFSSWWQALSTKCCHANMLIINECFYFVIRLSKPRLSACRIEIFHTPVHARRNSFNSIRHDTTSV